MNKTIVTHIRPDFDALIAVWLIKRYYPGFDKAGVTFVPAGETYEKQVVDSQASVIHVDTGLGKFDHHQLRERSSAARRILDYFLKERLITGRSVEVIERMVDLATMIDNFEEALLPEAGQDFYDLGIYQVMEGLKYGGFTDFEIYDFAQTAFEGLYGVFRQKLMAEEELEANSRTVDVNGIKTLILESVSDEASRLAQKRGAEIVVRRHPKAGNVQIKVRPGSKLNLKKLSVKLIELEGAEKWFYHVPSGKLLLNGSSKNMKEPTKLSVKEILKYLEESLE